MKWLVFICLSVLLFSCKKDISSSITTGSLPPTPTTFPMHVQSPFGVMIAGIADNYKVIAAKALAVSNVQAEITLNGFTQTLPYIDSLANNGFDVITNFDYYGPASKAVPFINNLPSLTAGINNVLNKFHPYLVAVENEEVNADYHSASVQYYINELSTATQVLHKYNIRVTNGGLTEQVLCVLTYRDYLNRGLTAQANDFAKRAMPADIISDLPNLSNHPQLQNRALAADTLIHAYKKMNIDYVNFHWYEPVIERWSGASISSPATQHVYTKAMSEVMNFLKNATGKTVISNEAGEMCDSPGIVQDMMQQFATSKTPFVIWYSCDVYHQSWDAVALNNSNGSLRSNGQAFLNFLQSNYSGSNQ